MNRYAWLAGVLVFLCGNPASATPILYDEFVDGDLPWLGELTRLVLGTGLNIVRGETSVFPFSPGADPDNFIFVVPSGMRLVSGRVDAKDSVGNMIELGWALYDDSLTDISLERLILSSPGSATFTTTPLGEGTYYIYGTSFVHPGGVASSLYEFGLEVTAVPEPAGSSLMWFGVAVALAVSRAPIFVGIRSRARTLHSASTSVK